jgi:hypothetical protein
MVSIELPRFHLLIIVKHRLHEGVANIYNVITNHRSRPFYPSNFVFVRGRKCRDHRVRGVTNWRSKCVLNSRLRVADTSAQSLTEHGSFCRWFANTLVYCPNCTFVTWGVRRADGVELTPIHSSPPLSSSRMAELVSPFRPKTWSIMSKSFLLEKVTSLLQNSLSRRTRVFIRSFLALYRVPTMANEYRLPAA